MAISNVPRQRRDELEAAGDVVTVPLKASGPQVVAGLNALAAIGEPQSVALVALVYQAMVSAGGVR